MNTGAKRRIQRDWPRVMDEFTHSGLSVRAFCQERGIALSLFYRHRRVLAADGAQRAFRRHDFLELSPRASAGGDIHITFPGRVEVSVSNHCDPGLLRAVLAQLQASSC